MALQSFLRDRSAESPTVLSAPPEKDVKGQGFLTPSFEHGAILVRNSAGAVTRLSWGEGKPEAKDRRRALPAGEYKVIGFRLNKTDENGDRWDLSASHPELRKLSVKAGISQRVELDETIRIRYGLRPHMIGFDMMMEQKAGVSIYRKGERIRLSYALQDAEGKTRHEGPLHYG